MISVMSIDRCIVDKHISLLYPNIMLAEPVVDVMEGIKIRRATDEEAVLLHHVLLQHTGLCHHKWLVSALEGAANEWIDDGVSTIVCSMEIAKRYYVSDMPLVATESATTRYSHRLLEASSLVGRAVETLFAVQNNGKLVMDPSLASIDAYAQFDRRPFIRVDSDYAKQVRHLRSLLDKHVTRDSLFSYAMSLWYNQRLMPRAHMWSLLSHISILELLLFEDSRGAGRMAEMVACRVDLWSERMRQGISYAQFGCSSSEAWMHLYKIRNAIAHGKMIGNKNPDILKVGPMERCVEFVQDVVRRILVQGLEEPPLLLALRRC